MTNPKDPLLKVGSERQRELFNHISKLANGFATDEVLGAILNVYVNALRQIHPTRDKAFDRLDQLNAQAKTMLDSHYDLGGQRRRPGIFPFNQTITMPHLDDRDKHLKT